MHILFNIAILLFSGMIFAKIISKLRLPHVTGYLIAGLLIGPSVLGLIPKEGAEKLSLISEIALSFIAYSIGSEFNIQNLKKLGKGVIIVTLFESLMAVVLVFLAMVFIFKQSVAFSLVIGAISAATAPAATLMVVRQYKAKGPVVNTLLPVVAMDDAVGIIAFGVCVAIAKALVNNSHNISVFKILFFPVLEIIAALLLGLIVGTLLAFITKKVKGEDELLSIILATLFATAGLAISFNLSSLLACMMVGATLTNLIPNNRKVFSTIDRFTPPVLIAFFTLAGVELDLSVLKQVGILGVGYVIVRVLGKLLGAYSGSKIAKFPKTVQRYLGFTLIPQAGVAIGLSMIAKQVLPPAQGEAVRAIVLAGTVIYELLGPMITKICLIKAGEIKET